MGQGPLPGLSAGVVLLVSGGYLALLFGIAALADRRAAAGRSVIASPWVYALSLGVYCSAWTYFGSVGRAATGGIWFLPIYLGPTLAMLLAWGVIRRMVRISRTYRVTSIAEHAWEHAREQSDFTAFLPHLVRVFELQHRYVECFEADHPYDPLLDDYEPGMRTAELRPVLEALRDGFVSGGTRRNLAWVRPHLTAEAGVTEDDLLFLADAQTSGGLLVVGEVPGYPVIGHTVAGAGITVR